MFAVPVQSCAGISSRTLAERLRALQRAGIVRRHSYPESPPRVEYELTDKGRDLLPILDAMTDQLARAEDVLKYGSVAATPKIPAPTARLRGATRLPLRHRHIF